MPSPRSRPAKQSTIRRPRVAGRIAVGNDDKTTTAPTPGAVEPSTERPQVAEKTAEAAPDAAAPDAESPVGDLDAETAALPAVPAEAAAAAEHGGSDVGTGGKSGAASSKSSWQRLVAEPLMPLGIVIVVFLGLASWFGVEAYQLRSDSSASNVALVDPEATSSVVGQITSAVQTVFSYNYTDTARTEQAAQSVLAGKAIDQYNQLYAEVKKQAPQQKLVLTTTVQSAGVKALTQDRAELLVFVDQRAVRTDNAQNSAGPAQLLVNAERIGGAWKITNMTVI